MGRPQINCFRQATRPRSGGPMGVVEGTAGDEPAHAMRDEDHPRNCFRLGDKGFQAQGQCLAVAPDGTAGVVAGQNGGARYRIGEGIDVSQLVGGWEPGVIAEAEAMDKENQRIGRQGASGIDSLSLASPKAEGLRERIIRIGEVVAHDAVQDSGKPLSGLGVRFRGGPEGTLDAPQGPGRTSPRDVRDPPDRLVDPTCESGGPGPVGRRPRPNDGLNGRVQGLYETRRLPGSVGRKLNGAAQIGGMDVPVQWLLSKHPGLVRRVGGEIVFGGRHWKESEFEEQWTDC